MYNNSPKVEEKFIPLWRGWAMIIAFAPDEAWRDKAKPDKDIKISWLKCDESEGIYGRGFIFFKYCVLFAKAR